MLKSSRSTVDLLDLSILGAYSAAAMESGVIALRVWALVRFAKITIQNFRHICSRTCQLESSHLGTKIAITFTIFGFSS